MRFLDKRRLKKAKERRQREGLYERAFRELEQGIVRVGLWAQAEARAEGDVAKCRAEYIKLRVQSYEDEIVCAKPGIPSHSLEAESAIDGPNAGPRNRGHAGKCDLCGSFVAINYGDASRTWCADCYSAEIGRGMG